MNALDHIRSSKHSLSKAHIELQQTYKATESGVDKERLLNLRVRITEVQNTLRALINDVNDYYHVINDNDPFSKDNK